MSGGGEAQAWGAPGIYAERRGLRQSDCSCGMSITMESFVANRSRPTRLRTYDADTGRLHRCPPSPSQPPPNDSWWAEQLVVEDQKHGAPPQSPPAQFRAAPRSNGNDLDESDDEFLARYAGEL